jgi:restriction system protein
MAFWLVRAGSHGQYEQKFLDESRIYLTWDGLNDDLSKTSDRKELRALLQKVYPQNKPVVLSIWTGQIWKFAKEMKPDDLVALPSKIQPAIHIGEITSDYHSQPEGPDPFYHWRSVNWIGEAIPRANFGKDILYSMGALLTICGIHRNDAEKRVRVMRANGWKPETAAVAKVARVDPAEDDAAPAELEQLAKDQISRLISAKFKGHGLALLVENILKAQGYTTYRSPEGPDAGIDILAGAGPLGFSSPRLCVQVKSQDTPVESKTLNELRGAMQSVGATEGLFVSWGGFKPTVYKQALPSFFNVRLWTQKELLENLFEHYDKLDPELRAELPLKRIWTVAAEEDEE